VVAKEGGLKILSFDPSMSATGWALLVDDGTPDGRLEGAGRITDSGGCVLERAWKLYSEVAALIGEQLQPLSATSRIIVEVPFNKARGGPKSRRSAMTLPTYGMAVGAVACAAKASGWEVTSVPAADWSRGLPGVMKDPYKTRRVMYAASIYGRKPREFGAKTTAGDVADAVLLARWSMLLARAGKGAA
jgi:hypothetical protein